MAWICEKVSPQSYQTWFDPIQPLELAQDRVLIQVPNPFFIDWFEQHNLHLLRESLARSLGTEPRIEWSVHPDYYKGNDATTTTVPGGHSQPLPKSVNQNRSVGSLNSRYTFDNFVIGPSNAFSHAAALAVAKAPGQTYNPLFIYGPTGLGKTHLMQAIGNHLQVQRANCRVTYVPCERFTNQLIEAISQRNTSEFREKYRNLDVLLIDDVHFLSGREATQEEFFHTFNALHDGQKQIVVTCDSPPLEMRKIEVRLLSRFNWGLVTDVSPPNLETRMAILHRKAAEEEIDLPDDVAYLISSQVKSNIRVLEGCLVKLAALSRLLDAQISQDLAQDVLKDVLDAEGRRDYTPEEIQDMVGQVFGVAPESIRGKRRTARIATARQVAMYLTRNHTHLTLTDIGRSFGHRDHSTVLHACGKIARLRVRDAEMEQTLHKLEEQLLTQRNTTPPTSAVP
jgi:chromosomal replication initiator protein